MVIDKVAYSCIDVIDLDFYEGIYDRIKIFEAEVYVKNYRWNLIVETIKLNLLAAVEMAIEIIVKQDIIVRIWVVKIIIQEIN